MMALKYYLSKTTRQLPRGTHASRWSRIRIDLVLLKKPFSRYLITGKSLSEAFFLQNMLCKKIVLNVRNSFCTQHALPRFERGIFMYWTCNSIKNLLLWVFHAKIRASDKDLPVHKQETDWVFWWNYSNSTISSTIKYRERDNIVVGLIWLWG